MTDFLYGYHTVAEALHSRPDSIREVRYVGQRKSRRLQAILATCRQRHIATQAVTAGQLQRLAGRVNHQGVLACFDETAGANANPQADLRPLCAGEIKLTALILALDGIADPHNLGACIRTANAVGVEAVICPKDKSAPVNATVRKVACGAVEATRIVTVVNLARALRQLRAAGYWVVGMDEQGETSLFEFQPQQPLVVVMGAEGRGMRHNIRKQCDYLLYIPMFGEITSLNVSVAAGICLYQLRSRQGDDRLSSTMRNTSSRNDQGK